MGILFQGCYTQFATMREEEPSYQQPPPCAVQNDSAYYGEDYDNWQSHQNLGLAYYYPCWNSYWSWDYGCVYPWYWDPWLWGPAFYIGYSYYPHYWGYGNYYRRYDHWGYRGYNYSRQYATRNSGYQRIGNVRQTGLMRYGNTGTETTYNGRVENIPRSTGSVVTQSRNAVTTRTLRNTSVGISTIRQRGNWFSPNVQQPRYRDQSNTIARNSRIGGARNRGNYRSQGTSKGQFRSGGRGSAPSYSRQSSTRTSSAPSAPASRSNGGSSRQSSGSGRSH